MPLQKLYEKVVFEEWDLIQVMKEHDPLNGETVTEDQFKKELNF